MIELIEHIVIIETRELATLRWILFGEVELLRTLASLRSEAFEGARTGNTERTCNEFLFFPEQLQNRSKWTAASLCPLCVRNIFGRSEVSTELDRTNAVRDSRNPPRATTRGERASARSARTIVNRTSKNSLRGSEKPAVSKSPRRAKPDACKCPPRFFQQ